MKITFITLIFSAILFSCSTGKKLTPQEISERNYRQIQFHETYGKELKEMGMYTASEIQYEQASNLRKRDQSSNESDSLLDFILDVLFFK